MITAKESLKVLEECFGNEIEFLNLKNHKKSAIRANTYQATINLMSIDILFALMEREVVKNVFFHPSAPPPGTHADGIAQRYRLYVEYYSDEK